MPAIRARRPRPGRQKDILRAFSERVAERGYDLTSLADIADELGLSKGTIMHHFQSKDRMLEIMTREYMKRRLEELRLLFGRYDSPQDRLAALISAQVTAHRDDRAATIAFSRELMRFADDPVMADVRRLRREFVEAIVALLEAGMRAGVFVQNEPYTVALQIVGMCNWCWTWLRPDGRLSVDRVSAIFVQTVFGGVLKDQSQPDMKEVLRSVAKVRKQVRKGLSDLQPAIDLPARPLDSPGRGAAATRSPAQVASTRGKT